MHQDASFLLYILKCTQCFSKPTLRFRCRLGSAFLTRRTSHPLIIIIMHRVARNWNGALAIIRAIFLVMSCRNSRKFAGIPAKWDCSTTWVESRFSRPRQRKTMHASDSAGKGKGVGSSSSDGDCSVSLSLLLRRRHAPRQVPQTPLLPLCNNKRQARIQH
jgi:hypothetical protein